MTNLFLYIVAARHATWRSHQITRQHPGTDQALRRVACQQGSSRRVRSGNLCCAAHDGKPSLLPAACEPLGALSRPTRSVSRSGAPRLCLLPQAACNACFCRPCPCALAFASSRSVFVPGQHLTMVCFTTGLRHRRFVQRLMSWWPQQGKQLRKDMGTQPCDRVLRRIPPQHINLAWYICQVLDTESVFVHVKRSVAFMWCNTYSLLKDLAEVVARMDRAG